MRKVFFYVKINLYEKKYFGPFPIVKETLTQILGRIWEGCISTYQTQNSLKCKKGSKWVVIFFLKISRVMIKYDIYIVDSIVSHVSLKRQITLSVWHFMNAKKYRKIFTNCATILISVFENFMRIGQNSYPYWLRNSGFDSRQKLCLWMEFF